MQREAYLVPISMGEDFCSHEEHFQPCDSNSVGGHGDLPPIIHSSVPLRFALSMSSQKFHPPPQIVGQHDDLEKRMVGLETLRGYRQNAFALCFPNQVLHISTLVIIINDVMAVQGQLSFQSEKWTTKYCLEVCVSLVRITP